MQKSILKKYFFISLTIVALYTAVIIFIISFFNYTKTTEETNYNNQIFLEESSQTIDNKLNTAVQYSSFIIEKNSIQEYLYSTKEALLFYPHIYDDIVSSLTSIDQMDLAIGIKKLSDNMIVSQDGYFLFADYLNHLGINPDFLDSSSLFAEDEMNSIYFIKDKDKINKNNTTFISKHYYPEIDQHLLVITTFPNESLLPQTNLINNGDFSIVGDTAISHFPKKNSFNLNFDYLKIAKTPSEYYTDLSILHTNTDNNVYARPSLTFKNIQYIYSVKKSRFLPYLLNYLTASFFYLLPLLIIGGIIIYFSTKKSYNPIENILLRINNHNVNAIPSTYELKQYSELDYILDNIDHMTIKNQELQKRMDDSLNALQNDFIVSVLYDDINKADIKSKLQDLKITELESGGTIVILSTEGISKEEEEFSENNLLIMRSKILRTIINLDNELFFIQFPLDYKNFCFIFSEKNRDTIYDQLSKISSYVEMELSIDLTFSVSDPVNSIFDFSAAFNEALLLNKKKYAYLDTQIILPTSLPIVHDDHYSYSLDNERFLMNAIIDNDRKKAEKNVDEILTKNLRQMDLDVVNIIKFKYVILNTIKRILNYYNKSFKEFSLKHSQTFKKLENNNPEEVYVLIEEIFKYLYDTVIPQNNDSYDPLTFKIIDYIKSNYTQDISLTDIAEKFNLTEGYVSKLLTKKANIHFKTYINNLKIRQAKKLLSEGSHNVSEVSNLVGYKNVNSFIRIFKKQEGITPGEFSKLRS
ncbi:helix-turn-helix transcriptional regulator [Desemzia sp. RIT804]|uniref:helix-turn-helix transcriptional regulator n=1 Tax=Desemzia sp. RIT 804 TaxID=2810209 RepID=UPI0019519AEC|nr:AraC family transcriptional regulator [Desemzia sp. RIT 804]MBM6615330.1 helix-turn-helix transcriptional regulator [Desemzia sp. RIT 804]